ncbi:MAG: B12-binding domain-containing radical SAM protein [Spirochaetales bacterium]|nr:B12-binding domain-containing radical SAM protein [Spirochaetales bacterium]
MKAVIAIPSVKDFYFTPTRAAGLGSVAAKHVLENHNIETIILNFSTMKRKLTPLSLPPELNYLKEYLIPEERGAVSFFRKYYRFGPDSKICAEIILENKPDLVLISCFAWAYAEETVNLAAAIKNKSKAVSIAVGGAGVSVAPEYFENFNYIDFVISGEAETAISTFLIKQYGINKKDGEPVKVPGFYWNMTGISQNKKTRYFSAMLTRGCPKACRFCANHLVHGRKFRKAEISEIEQGIKNFPHSMNIHLNFEDDNLLFDKEYFFTVLDIVKKYFPDAEFSAENGLDYTMMDEETTEKLISLGFKSFNLSMASSEDTILSKENRKACPSKLDDILNIASKKGIHSTTYFICGLEADTKKTVINNLLRLHNLPTLTGISMFYPVPGLPGFSSKKMIQYPPRLCAGSSAYPWTGSLSTIELITAFRLSRLSNMIKTINGKIPNLNQNNTDIEKCNNLLEKTLKTGKLHTMSKSKIIEVPCQDKILVSDFLSRVQK